MEKPYDKSELIGMPLEQAKAYLKLNGLFPRIIWKDGLSMIGTCDLNPYRIDILVKDGILITRKEAYGY
jgi:hypothetical protein